MQSEFGGNALSTGDRTIVLARVEHHERVARANEQREFVEGIFFGHESVSSQSRPNVPLPRPDGNVRRDPVARSVKPALAAIRALDDGRHRAEFYSMWRTMYAAGLAHPKAFETMGPRQSQLTEEIRQWLLAGTKRGRPLEELIKAGARRFEVFESALLTLGEESGSLEEALRLLADFYMKKHLLMLWVKKKMAYPIFTGLAACFIAPFPLLFFGNPVAYLMSAGSGVLMLLAGAGGAIAGAAARYGRQPAMARARMARALTTGIEAGLTLPRAMRLAADASANPEIREHISRIGERELSTQSIGESLQGCPHLTPEFVAIIATSERTGDFSGLAKLADLYEDGFR